MADTLTKPHLPKTVVTLGVVSLLNDASSEMIYPLLPFFLREHLKASVAFVGLVEGIAETTASLLKLASGWVSDRSGHHKLLTFVGYALASVARPLLSISTAPWQVLGLRFTDRVGKGIRTSPRDALLANSCEENIRGMAFGLHRAMDHLGAAVGPLIATAILSLSPSNYRLVFGIAAIPALLSLLVLWFGVEETPKSRKFKGEKTTLNFSVSLRAWTDLPIEFRWYLAAVLIFTLSNSSDAFLLLRAKGAGVPEQAIPLLWMWLHVVKSATGTHGGILSDRIGRARAIAIGWLVYAGVYIAFPFLQSAWQVWLTFTIYGLYFSLTEGAERALVADLLPAEKRGKGYGMFHFIVGVGMMPASVLFGLLWQLFNHKVAFLFGAGLALFAATLLSARIRR
ncbi:MAG: MFS transporter [Candidatus Fervidibacter sp.]|uniref:MFS transporter n=1 Tax=Candidatus Fervidibacter sp. TaxID=3100871 RepID=UPI0040496DB8